MGDLSKAIVTSLISCAELIFYAKDGFLKEKLFSKISDLLSTYITHDMDALGVRIDGLLEFMDYPEHYNSIKKEPLSLAKKHLLKLKLEFIKARRSRSILDSKSSAKLFSEKSSMDNQSNMEIKQNLKNKKQPTYRSNPNKERILDFIRRSPHIRTREVIDQFNLISGRTVKRNLAELTREGLVRKKLENRATYYHSVDN